MKFYRVKETSDNVNIISDHKIVGFLVARELITESEYKKRKLNNVNSKHFEIVDVKKNKTHWFFGARFADDFSYADFARKKYHY